VTGNTSDIIGASRAIVLKFKRIVGQEGPTVRPVSVFLFWGLLLTGVWGVTELLHKFVFHITTNSINPFAGTRHLYDLQCFSFRFSHLHHPSFFYEYSNTEPFMYPPIVALLYNFFYSFKLHSTIAFYACAVVPLLLMIFMVARALAYRSLSRTYILSFLGVVILCSYPFWFEYWLGNMEIFVFFLVALGVWAFFRGYGYLAAFCFGLAGAAKIFPLVYFGLLLAKKCIAKSSLASLRL
jgi:hypothetical protein